jgi:hypothetical protein
MPMKDQLEKGKQILKEGYDKAKPTLNKVEDATMEILGYIGQTLCGWYKKHQENKATTEEATRTSNAMHEHHKEQEPPSNKHRRS